MITSDIDALSERVEHESSGVLIPGDIDIDAVQQSFITQTVQLLRDHGRRDRYSNAARKSAAVLDVDVVAGQWERLLA